MIKSLKILVSVMVSSVSLACGSSTPAPETPAETTTETEGTAEATTVADAGAAPQ